jgi:glucoamylase
VQKVLPRPRHGLIHQFFMSDADFVSRGDSGCKLGIGSALADESRVWFTIGRAGGVEEVFFGSPDAVFVHRIEIVVVAPDDTPWWESEQGAIQASSVRVRADSAEVPAWHTCSAGPGFVLHKMVLAHPVSSALLLRVWVDSARNDLVLYAAVAAANPTRDARARIGSREPPPILLSSRAGAALAMVAKTGWTKCGIAWPRTKSALESALLAGIDESAMVSLDARPWLFGALTGKRGELVVAGAEDELAAARLCREACCAGFDELWTRSAREWTGWHESLPLAARATKGGESLRDLAAFARQSATVLRVLAAKGRAAGAVASLATPWGDATGAPEQRTYHLAWTRDLFERAIGLLAFGVHDAVDPTLRFLEATQRADGHWPQNMRLDGTPHWHTTELDEVALPVLLIDAARAQAAISEQRAQELWPMMRRACQFLLREGPASKADRWEDAAGYTPYTLAVTIAALLIAAERADHAGDSAFAMLLRDTADAYEEGIERWLYVENDVVSRELGLARLLPTDSADGKVWASPARAGRHREAFWGTDGRHGQLGSTGVREVRAAKCGRCSDTQHAASRGPAASP